MTKKDPKSFSVSVEKESFYPDRDAKIKLEDLGYPEDNVVKKEAVTVSSPPKPSSILSRIGATLSSLTGFNSQAPSQGK